MTLDEAIEHCEQTARSCDGGCSEDHRQLSEWLKELKQLREERDEMRTNVTMAILWQDTLKTTIDRLRAENDELRDLVKDVQRFHECGRDCTECPLFDQCHKGNLTNGCIGSAIIHDRMRALGIEVE